MHRFVPDRLAAREVTAARLGKGLGRRMRDVPDRLSWRFGRDAKLNRTRLETFRDSHVGQPCVIVASGPSLNLTDMRRLKDYPTFAMNRSYLLYEDWGFTPTYFVSINDLVVRQFADDIADLPMEKFVTHSQRRSFRDHDESGRPHYLRLRQSLNDSFIPDVTRPICSGGTVTYVCLQLAYFMGFRKVVLVGMDHRFAERGTPNATEVRAQEVDQSHAHPDYFPKGVSWQLPDLRRSEIAYGQARRAYQRVGRRVIDATVGGACQVFEKMPLDDALDC